MRFHCNDLNKLQEVRLINDTLQLAKCDNWDFNSVCRLLLNNQTITRVDLTRLHSYYKHQLALLGWDKLAQVRPETLHYYVDASDIPSVPASFMQSERPILTYEIPSIEITDELIEGVAKNCIAPAGPSYSNSPYPHTTPPSMILLIAGYESSSLTTDVYEKTRRLLIALETNSFQSLCIVVKAENELIPQHIEDLAKKKTTLKHFYLSYEYQDNYLHYGKCLDFGGILRANPTLQTLRAYRVKMEEDAALALFAELKTNTILTVLHIEFVLTEGTKKGFLELLRTNRTLQKVWVKLHAGIPEERQQFVDEMSKILKQPLVLDSWDKKACIINFKETIQIAHSPPGFHTWAKISAALGFMRANRNHPSRDLILRPDVLLSLLILRNRDF